MPIDLNEGFRRLIRAGLPPESAWRRLTTALQTPGVLRLWCNGNLLALDYVVNSLRFYIREGDLVVTPAGPLGWQPGTYVFELDDEEFKHLSAFSRHDLKQFALAEAQRRERDGLVVNAGILWRWLNDSYGNQVIALPTPRGVRGWIAEWREQGRLRARE